MRAFNACQSPDSNTSNTVSTPALPASATAQVRVSNNVVYPVIALCIEMYTCSRAFSVIGPDPCDVGGIAELKWIAEYADLHGIQVAPHGIFDGLFGLAALVQMSAALPPNFIAFEYPIGKLDWWHDIVEGLPNPLVQDGFITVWDTAGLGVRFNVDKALAYLQPEDAGFFE